MAEYVKGKKTNMQTCTLFIYPVFPLGFNFSTGSGQTFSNHSHIDLIFIIVYVLVIIILPVVFEVKNELIKFQWSKVKVTVMSYEK